MYWVSLICPKIPRFSNMVERVRNRANSPTRPSVIFLRRMSARRSAASDCRTRISPSPRSTPWRTLPRIRICAGSRWHTPAGPVDLCCAGAPSSSISRAATGPCRGSATIRDTDAKAFRYRDQIVMTEKLDLDHLQPMDRTAPKRSLRHRHRATGEAGCGPRLFMEIGKPKPGDGAPFTTHWCLAQPVYPMSELGPDGHPTRAAVFCRRCRCRAGCGPAVNSNSWTRLRVGDETKRTLTHLPM